MKQILRSLWIAVAALAVSAAHAPAQDWPSKPIRLIVPFAPGGAPDVWGRILAELPEVKRKLELDAFAAKPLTPRGLAAFMQSETARWAPIAQESGMKR
jgi:tripartite-type tricarboxylate transporter receptor subunit TctC